MIRKLICCRVNCHHLWKYIYKFGYIISIFNISFFAVYRNKLSFHRHHFFQTLGTSWTYYLKCKIWRPLNTGNGVEAWYFHSGYATKSSQVCQRWLSISCSEQIKGGGGGGEIKKYVQNWNKKNSTIQKSPVTFLQNPSDSPYNFS